MYDPLSQDISELGADLASGATTSLQLVEAYLARIAAHDKKGAAINAMTWLCDDAAAQARQLDQERANGLVRGPLHGVPIVVKDNIDLAGLPTTAGSALLREHRPARDASVVRRLRQAGAIVLGKTNMSEFACSNGRYGYGSLAGLTLNPYNRARNAAGSSSGSGAAVAAGFAAAALGTDTFGSVRAPACVAGLAGLRPTLGLIPVDGILPLSLSFDTVGPLARRVRDVALLLRSMACAVPGGERGEYLDALDAGALRGQRIGVVADFPGEDEEVQAIVGQSLDRLRDLGAVLVDLRVPAPATALHPILLAPLADAEWPGQLDEYLKKSLGAAPLTMAQLVDAATAWSAACPTHDVNPRTLAGMRRALEAARQQTAVERARAQATLAGFRAALMQRMRQEDVTALVFPTLSCPASPRYDQPDPSYVEHPGNPYAALYVASAAGLPEISVPAGRARAGVPVGLSFMGAPHDEARLLGLAYAFEQSVGARLEPVLEDAGASGAAGGVRTGGLQV
ncbi:amidase [Achromobacter aloeverae]|uniref:amidase n=1 Tax=Achromobacter aloeverae TaxID=1750518 RepID=UPI001300D637|nr:amidase family protein [Achromobacter aloeverae]